MRDKKRLEDARLNGMVNDPYADQKHRQRATARAEREAKEKLENEEKAAADAQFLLQFRDNLARQKLRLQSEGLL
jgi:hypothetical protein